MAIKLPEQRRGEIMKNIELSYDQKDKNILIIKVDLNKNFGPSKSGKTIIIASTEGNVSIGHDGTTKLGLNIYK